MGLSAGCRLYGNGSAETGSVMLVSEPGFEMRSHALDFN